MTDTSGLNWSRMHINFLKYFKWHVVILVIIFCLFILIQPTNCYGFNDVNSIINEPNRFNYSPRSVRSSIAHDNFDSNHVTYSGMIEIFGLFFTKVH